MKSHTVPKKLLEQFSYDDPITKSKRLWRYEKGRSPYNNASPRTATRWESHFADPRNAAKEVELESRLKSEVEDPVNDFICLANCETFALSTTHIRLLTAYITSLFHRSQARQSATRIHRDMRLESMRSLLGDDKMSALSLQFTKNAIESGHLLDRPFTKAQVREMVNHVIDLHSTEEYLQHEYIFWNYLSQEISRTRDR